MSQVNEIEEVLKGLEKLPTLPGIAMKILELVRDEDTNLKEIADVLSTDPPLSAQVLKLINSLREETIRDGLTNLFNYQRFHESLEKEVYRAKRYKLQLTVILADIDHFKAVNDKYGHLAGDYCLKKIADCLKDSLRESDSVARYGGEKFAVILPETDLDGAFIVAERVREDIDSMTIDYEGEKISITVSFGIASLDPVNDVSKNDLIKKADYALYQAKKAGRNKCCLYETRIEK